MGRSLPPAEQMPHSAMTDARMGLLHTALVTSVMADFGRPPLTQAAGKPTVPVMRSTHSQTQGPAIEVRDLRKSYGEVEAVRGVSFEVARGEVFCLLGPNGAGKTTIVEILEGYRLRSGGDARVLGIDPAAGERELREPVGIVLQQCGVQQRPDRSPSWSRCTAATTSAAGRSTR